jgi:hypothetical protein
MAGLVVALLVVWRAPAFAVERGAVLISFEHERIGPQVSCDGSVRISSGEIESVQPVLFEPADGVEGVSWKCATQPDAKPATVKGAVRTCAQPKGVIVRTAAPNTASLTVDCALGEFAVELSALREGRSVEELDGQVTVARIPYASRLSDPAGEDDYPTACVGASGRPHVAWQSFDGVGEGIWCAVGEGEDRSEPLKVTRSRGDYYRPCLVASAGGVWLIWAAQVDGNWDLFALKNPIVSSQSPLRLTRSEGTDFNHRAAVTPDGTIWLCWQTAVNGQYDIMLAPLSDAGLGKAVRVTDHPADDWEPSIAAGPGGRLAIAWDTYRNGSFDVYLRTYESGRLSEPTPIAASGDCEAHSAVAIAPDGGVWVAWDNGGSEWGKARRRIHALRSLGMGCLRNGRLHRPKAPPQAAMPSTLRTFCELPQLGFDGSGRLWLVFRHLTPVVTVRPATSRSPRTARGIWNAYAMSYADGAWGRPMLLSGSNGRNAQTADTALGPDGRLRVTYMGDARQRVRAEMPVNRNVFVAAIGNGAGGQVALPVEPAEPPEPVTIAADKRLRRTMTVAGKTYTLLYGDTHRHTDLSRCAMCYDGSVEDTYRYAIDAAAIDFLAISDHDQDLQMHRFDKTKRPDPVQRYMWWRSQKLCDLFHLPNAFLTMYGYEHGGSMKARGGHKNVIYTKRANPCIELDAPEDLFRELEDLDAIAIPHQLADGGSATDWSKFNGKYEVVSEIFQARGSYEYQDCPREARVIREGHFIWDALARGVKTGIIASSDHGTVHGAYAGVYVEEVSRAGIMRALRARRTFGATDTMAVQFSIGGDSAMGEEMTVAGVPRLRVKMIGTDVLDRVDVVKSNEFVYTHSPGAAEFGFEFEDTVLQPGASCYYYVRAIQTNNEIAWSSPIWVTRTG